MTAYTIEQELRAGEKLYWKGKPNAGIALHSSDAFVIPFSLIWGGGVLSGLFADPKATAPNAHGVSSGFPELFMLPFVAMALYLIFGRFILDAIMRSKTEYAVTSERAIIASAFFARKVQSINLKTISDISVTEKKDGTGTIIFGAGFPYGRMPRGLSLFGMSAQASAFEMITDVRQVDAQIKRAQKTESAKSDES